MKVRGAAISVAILICATVQVWAVKDKNAPVKRLDVKEESCGSWTAERATGRTQALEYWVLGFVSGVNLFGSSDTDLLAHIDANAVWAWMDNYCHAHPLNTVSMGVGALLRELG